MKKDLLRLHVMNTPDGIASIATYCFFRNKNDKRAIRHTMILISIMGFSKNELSNMTKFN